MDRESLPRSFRINEHAAAASTEDTLYAGSPSEISDRIENLNITTPEVFNLNRDSDQTLPHRRWCNY